MDPYRTPFITVVRLEWVVIDVCHDLCL